MTSARPEPLEWDSAFFGRRIARLAGGADGPAFEAALDWCRRNEVECLYLLTDADDVATLRRAEHAGADLVDVRLELTVRPLERERAAPRREVRPAQAGDVAALRAVAATCHRATRFYADGRFDHARCDELYSTWIERSCAGWAQAVFCAEVDGAAAGYVTCHLRDGARGEVGLFGVGELARGRGLGRALVERALAWFVEQGTGEVSVATQARSLDAQRLYQSVGFRASKAAIWHHLWLGDASPR